MKNDHMKSILQQAYWEEHGKFGPDIDPSTQTCSACGEVGHLFCNKK